MNIRKLAQGERCLVRLPDCDGGGETTALAHYRLSGYCGTGLKPDDRLGAFACASCHDVVDGRRKTSLPRDYIRLLHAEGCLRTWVRLREITGNAI